MPAEDGAAGVAISDDGRRVAVLGRSTLSVWDLTSATADAQRCQAAGIGSPFKTSLNWVDDEHLMADRNVTSLVLFSLKHEMVVWNYHFDRRAPLDLGGRRMRDIVNGHLVYTATVMTPPKFGLVVGAVTLPGPKVADATAALNTEALLALKAGSSIRLDVRAGNDTSRVQQVLAGKIAANGWQLDPNASTVMIAAMGHRACVGGGEANSAEVVSLFPMVSCSLVVLGAGGCSTRPGNFAGGPIRWGMSAR